MGNILGSQRVFYVGYEYARKSPVHAPGDGSSDDAVYASYGWRQFFRDLFGCPQSESEGSRGRDSSGGWGDNPRPLGVKIQARLRHLAVTAAD
ncbi:hypothetical protein F4814DRAFT_460172 [Daldinia grandis]|nr:hypothetical protein F4814DRAFT_460172 [Daldinia grandis]